MRYTTEEIPLDAQFDEIVREMSKANFEAVQHALNVCAKEFSKRMANVSPINKKNVARAGTFKNSWDVDIYKNTVYVYNSAETKTGIPLSNIINKQPQTRNFIPKTWSSHQEEIYNIFIREYAKKINIGGL